MQHAAPSIPLLFLVFLQWYKDEHERMHIITYLSQITYSVDTGMTYINRYHHNVREWYEIANNLHFRLMFSWLVLFLMWTHIFPCEKIKLLCVLILTSVLWNLSGWHYPILQMWAQASTPSLHPTLKWQFLGQRSSTTFN